MRPGHPVGMAVSETPRHKLKKYSAGTDPHPGRTVHNSEVEKLEQLPAIKQGSTGSRPLSGVGKVLYWDEAVKRFVYDDGTEWQDVAPIGGAIPTAVTAGGTASEGASSRAARADHTHTFPLATTKTAGAMPASDKSLLDGATGANEGSHLVRRYSDGSATFSAVSLVGSTLGSHAARRDYVDNADSPLTGTIRVAQSTFDIAVPGDSSIIEYEIMFPDNVMRKRPHFVCSPFGTSTRLPNVEVWWTVDTTKATVYIRSTTAFPSVGFTWLAVEA